MTSGEVGISVVVTCYNLERWIGQTIRSVLDQRDPGPFEIIVVDDCSTDASAAIVREFPDVRLIQTSRNEGVLLAMLAGIEAARFDTISLLDGDDIWEEGKLAAVREAFAADPAVALVTHDVRFIDASGKIIPRESRPHEEIGRLPPGERAEAVRRGVLWFRDYVWLGSALSFRRGLGALDDFSEFARALADPRNCYQDWPLAYWIAARPEAQMAYLDSPLLQYRIHGANHSGDARTIDRAVRNYTRQRNTLQAMRAIAVRNDLGNEARLLGRRERLSEAHVDLYQGKRIRALATFVRSIPYLKRGQLPKEAARFAIGALLGPRVLMKLAAKSSSQETSSQVQAGS